ncbi:hypothetical protein ACFZ8E_05715 [Methylobacterium sp. HMF5984]|uniref:hypothetical protein n=1 Tax=Methylobacterium sp. HMF5984 TaxID=3367370 RepID=UPI003853EF45
MTAQTQTQTAEAGDVTTLREAAEMAALYLRTGFINCERCGHEQPTVHTDAQYALDAALAASPAPRAPAVPEEVRALLEKIVARDRTWLLRERVQSEDVIVEDNGKHYKVLVLNEFGLLAHAALRTLAAAPAAPPADGGTVGLPDMTTWAKLTVPECDHMMRIIGALDDLGESYWEGAREASGTGEKNYEHRDMHANNILTHAANAFKDMLRELGPKDYFPKRVPSSPYLLTAARDHIRGLEKRLAYLEAEAALSSRTPAGAAGDPGGYVTAEAAEKEANESYEIGKRDGYEAGVSDAALRVGLDGEYRCSPAPERHCPDVATMLAQISERVEELEATRPASPAPAASAKQTGDVHTGSISNASFEYVAPAVSAEQCPTCEEPGACPDLGCAKGYDRNAHNAEPTIEPVVDEAALAPAAQVNPGRDLPDDIRVPLHELQADADYLFGRVAADGSCAGVMAASVKVKLKALEEAILAARPVGEGDAGWQPIETAPKDGTEVPCLAPEYDGPVMLKFYKHNGLEAWRDWDQDIYEPTRWFKLPAARPTPSPAKGGN